MAKLNPPEMHAIIDEILRGTEKQQSKYRSRDDFGEIWDKSAEWVALRKREGGEIALPASFDDVV
jgi:hypothetical protein